MRKKLLTIVLLSMILTVKGQPSITDLSYTGSVPIFQLFEISFQLGPYSNPYDPDTISVYAVFNGPNNKCDTVIGFYYEKYGFYMDSSEWYEHAVHYADSSGWKIRFTPDEVGIWYFCVYAIDRHGETIMCSNKAKHNSFNCLPANNADGFITKANTRFYINNMPIGTRYKVHWYNTETGEEYSNLVTYTTVQQTLLGRKYITIQFPSSIRNLNTQTISNTFGDAVFAIYLYS